MEPELGQANASVISAEQANIQVSAQVDTTQPAKESEPVNWEVKYKQLQGTVQKEVEEKKSLRVELANAKALHLPIQSIQEEIRAHGERLARVQDAMEAMKGGETPAVSYVDQYQQQTYVQIEANTLNRVNAKLSGVGIYNNDPRLEEASILFAEAQKARNPRLLSLVEREIDKLLSTIPPRAENNNTINDFDTRVNQAVDARLKSLPIKPELLKMETGQASNSGTSRGRKPTYDELKATDPFETERKVRAGEWKL